MADRIALLGIYHESNTFIPRKTVLEDFRNGHWFFGDEIAKEYRNAHHEIGGMLEVLENAGLEACPVMFAEATPGGIITTETYETLLQSMLECLKGKLPVDGCLVIPHGAGVSEQESDMDGHWLTMVREVLGEDVPIMGTLDLHANVSQRMITATNALVAYRKNPHLDQRECGKEAASLLVNYLKGKCKPVQYLVQTPLTISIEQQLTDVEPCKSLYEVAAKAGRETGVMSVSVALGFPYADVHEMGTSVLVVTDNDSLQARRTAEELGTYLIKNRHRYIGLRLSVDSAIKSLDNREGPTLLLDMGDNIGGGSPGNGLGLLRELEKEKKYRYFSYQFDPIAAGMSANCRIGDSFPLMLTGFDETGPASIVIQVTLKSIVDGRFREDQPRHGGQVAYDMGVTAIVETPGGGTLMVSSKRIPPFSLKQLTAFGIEPKDFDVLVAKGVNAPIAAYGPVCKHIVQVDTPGVTQADVTRFSFNHRRKPLFPFEDLEGVWNS